MRAKTPSPLYRTVASNRQSGKSGHLVHAPVISIRSHSVVGNNLGYDGFYANACGLARWCPETKILVLKSANRERAVFVLAVRARRPIDR